MHLGLYIPPFDELADPAVVARLCAEAEEAGWAGAFVRDQVRWRKPVVGVPDPQITLAAIASAGCQADQSCSGRNSSGASWAAIRTRGPTRVLISVTSTR